MEKWQQEHLYFFDLRDVRDVFERYPYVNLNKSQIEDILFYLCENMSIDFNSVINAISLFNSDPFKRSSNFDFFPAECQDSLKLAMAEGALILYQHFRNKNMFDCTTAMTGGFPFILKDIVNSNLIFMKDLILGDVEVNMFG